MQFTDTLIHGTLISRYKRFLADIQLDDGAVITAHCTNSGSMKSCIEEGAEVYLSPNDNPRRRTHYTWEMIKINNQWVGINTLNPNKLAAELVLQQQIPGLTGYSQVTREVTFEDSRFDLYAQNARESCFIEVKNVSLRDGDQALFPDAVTVRGQKHLETLMRVKQSGVRAVMLYIIQRMDVHKFGPARLIDPQYALKLKKAYEAGVEIIPLQVKVSPEEIVPVQILPFDLDL